MSILANVVQQLQKERVQAQRRIEQLDEALKALSGFGGLRGISGRAHRAQAAGGKRRTMSAEARKRIAAAQRARLGEVEGSTAKEMSEGPCAHYHRNLVGCSDANNGTGP